MKKTAFLVMSVVSSIAALAWADTPDQIAARKAREEADQQTVQTTATPMQTTPAQPADNAASAPAAAAPAQTADNTGNAPAPAQPAVAETTPAPTTPPPAPETQAPAPVQTAPEPVAAAEPVVTTVSKIAFGTGVESRELHGETKEFDESAGRVYCWTKVSVSQTPVTIKHVWYRNGQNIVTIPLTISYPTARTWSNNKVSIGNWEVAVLDGTGKEIARESFTVKETPPAPAPAQAPATPSTNNP